MKTLLLVGLGSACGGILRFLAVEGVARLWPHKLPLGTILVNVTGSFAIGFLAGLTRPSGEPVLSGDARNALLVGVLGGYTTFSAFSLQTLNLARDGEWPLALWNVLLSVLLCLVAVFAGHAVAKSLT